MGVNDTTINFEDLRYHMVDEQIIHRGITDSQVIEAMRRVPRHQFVPLEEVRSAYADNPVPIGYGQTISQPYMVAIMTQCLKPYNDKIVLEIGTGSGYQTAILAELYAQVYTVERINKLTQRAQRTLDQLAYKNIRFFMGDGILALEDSSVLFDGIMVTAASPERPDYLLDRLTPQGCLVVPIGDQQGQVLTLFTKMGSRIKEESICRCIFVPLIGQHGWRNGVVRGR